ncbi:MAG: DUF1585 domain-containing protein, partial [Myxococcales bacterium]|nr:DUF1585 domain-containing protein [Myxococcales bacterium]
LADTEIVSECMGRHLFRYATGRSETYKDFCEIESMAQIMRDSGGSLQEIFVAMVLSESFRSRPAL